jgi:hypothetical protein
VVGSKRYILSWPTSGSIGVCGIMPELRRYVVRQEREVVVSASNPTDAAVLADRAFSNTKTPEDQLNITKPVREISIEAREDY